MPLAGPANRQGRIAADHIFGRDARYRGTQGTAIVGVFDRTAAMTGASEKSLLRANRPYRKVYDRFPNSFQRYRAKIPCDGVTVQSLERPQRKLVRLRLICRAL